MTLFETNFNNISVFLALLLNLVYYSVVFLSIGGIMISQNIKHEILKNIEITKDSAQNNIQTALESYTEIITRLNLLTYLLISENEK